MNVYSIDAAQPFLDVLAAAIIEGRIANVPGIADDPFALASVRLMLPTRRACRAMNEAFIRISKGRATLLPVITPIGEQDDDEGLFANLLANDALEAGRNATNGIHEHLPVISKLDRHLVLTRLVQAWSAQQHAADPEHRMDNSLAQSSGLAAELAGLLDALETDEADTSNFAELVPEHLASHWQTTLTFLRIMTEFWPAYLEENRLTSPMAGRNAQLNQLERRLALNPPSDPVIIAGVTGSIPATARLMKTVASLDKGAVILPGLDLDCLDDAAWQAITSHPEHPQSGFQKLLEQLDLNRNDVRSLVPDDSASIRSRFIAEAMRPASTTDQWYDYVAGVAPADVADSLSGTTYLEAPTAEAEAEAVALILREAIETPGKTAALISPDRILARRVAVRLQQWGLRVDDSAGRPFIKTASGAFLDLLLEAWAQDFQPAPLMALLKHPLTRLGLPVGDMRLAGRALELIALRRAYLGQGLDGLEQALDNAFADRGAGERLPRAVRRLSDRNWDAARDLITRLRNAFAPLLELDLYDSNATLSEIAAAHAKVAERLTMLPDEAPNEVRPAGTSGVAIPQPDLFDEPAAVPPTAEKLGSEDTVAPIWHGDAGECASLLIASLMDTERAPFSLAPVEYPEFYRSIVAGEAVRSRIPVHPRISIWGPYEARLQQVDVAILGGLNEGVWPQIGQPDAWLNRSMRAEIGLPPPEQIMGFAAHDFVNFLSGPQVYLTRATKQDGVPTVASRWLLRMQALLDGMGIPDAMRPTEDQPWLDWAEARDRPVADIKPVDAPQPRPPVAARPSQLSVTRIEKWIANPYAIFANSILGLELLDPLGLEPDARLKGQIIHEALNRFTRDHPSGVPGAIRDELARHADDVLAHLTNNPTIMAFWHPRFMRFAEWFAEHEPSLRQNIERIFPETSGRMQIPVPTGNFTLTAKADRIDIADDKTASIYDYKTGQPPTAVQVANMRSPQLPLEAAILRARGFAEISVDYPEVTETSKLTYINASGGEPPGKITHVSNGKISPAELADEALDALQQLVIQFADPNTPYEAKRRAAFRDTYKYDEFDHLARVDEWSTMRSGEVQ